MKLLRDHREMNYAYNINNSPNNTKTKKISFNTLSKNFYEDLITSDMNIKNNRLILNKIKSKSIKESIYTNKMVPSSWRTMLGYQNHVYRVIDKDPAFAVYLGRSQKENNGNKFFEAQHLKSVNDSQSYEQKPIPDFIKKYLAQPEDVLNSSEVKNNENEKKIKDDEKNKDDDKIKINRRPSQLYQKGIMFDKNLIVDDKLISSKLDEYRTKYDLNKYMYDIKNKRNLDKEKQLNNILTPNPRERETNYRQFLKTRTQNDKEHVLKSSIYYNLISKDNDKMKLRSSLQKKNLKPIINPRSLYLHHNNEFDKVIEITNPKIKRDLELINYYGPLYTHCKLCNNRNLEFYQNSEPNQTLKLLHFLKRMKLGDKDKDKEDNKA
jgi:hypothetical protein